MAQQQASATLVPPNPINLLARDSHLTNGRDLIVLPCEPIDCLHALATYNFLQL